MTSGNVDKGVVPWEGVDLNKIVTHALVTYEEARHDILMLERLLMRVPVSLKPLREYLKEHDVKLSDVPVTAQLRMEQVRTYPSIVDSLGESTEVEMPYASLVFGFKDLGPGLAPYVRGRFRRLIERRGGGSTLFMPHTPNVVGFTYKDINGDPRIIEFRAG